MTTDPCLTLTLTLTRWAIHTWASKAATRAARLRLLLRCVARLRGSSVACALETWRACAAEHKARLAPARRAAARLMAIDTARALGAWAEATLARHRLRQLSPLSPQAAVARRAWRVWVDWVASAVATQHMTWRVAMRLLYIAAARALARWMDAREAGVAARAAGAALRRVGMLWLHRQQVVALRAWVAWRETREATRAAAVRCASRRLRRQEAAALASWRDAAAEAGGRRCLLRERAARAARVLRARREAVALAHWRAAACLIATHLASVISTHAALRCRLHEVVAFRAWREEAVWRGHTRLLATRALRGRIQLPMRRALLAWVEAVGTAVLTRTLALALT